MSLEKQFASSELWDISRTDVDKAYFQSVLTFDNIKEIEYRQDKRIKTVKVKFTGSSLIISSNPKITYNSFNFLLLPKLVTNKILRMLEDYALLAMFYAYPNMCSSIAQLPKVRPYRKVVGFYTITCFNIRRLIHEKLVIE